MPENVFRLARRDDGWEVFNAGNLDSSELGTCGSDYEDCCSRLGYSFSNKDVVDERKNYENKQCFPIQSRYGNWKIVGLGIVVFGLAAMALVRFKRKK